jgi:hypothetical protein
VKPRGTLLELSTLLAAGGSSRPVDQLRAIPKGMRVTQLIVEWALASLELDEPLNAEQVADYWGASYRTTYRRLAEFRELWASDGAYGRLAGRGYETPQTIVDELAPELRRRVSSVAELVGHAPAPELAIRALVAA